MMQHDNSGTSSGEWQPPFFLTGIEFVTRLDENSPDGTLWERHWSEGSLDARLAIAEAELDSGLGRDLDEVISELQARHFPNRG